MGLTINTNVASLNAQNNLNKSSSALSTSMERLSSGLRINSAKDDAAGLAISDRMTSQVTGLDQAARNANDGISLAQTAEGALQESTNILQRIRELAVQSANDTNTGSDRASLNDEVTQLKEELDRIAETTEFNGKAVIDGTMEDATFQVGANAGENQTISFSIDSAQAADLSQVGTTIEAPAGNAVRGTTLTGSVAANTIQVNGNDVGAATNNKELASALNAADDSITAKAVNYQEFDFNEVQLDLKEASDPIKVTTLNDTSATAVNLNDFSVNGNTTAVAGTVANDASAIAAAINDGSSDVVATATNKSDGFALATVAGNDSIASSFDLKVNDAEISFEISDGNTATVDVALTVDQMVAAINADSSMQEEGISAATNAAGEIVFSTDDGGNLSISGTTTGVGSGTLLTGISSTAATFVGDLEIAGAAGKEAKVETGSDLGDQEVTINGSGEAAVGGDSEVQTPLNAGDLVINGNDVGAVAGDAKAIAEAIQLADSAVIATAKNSQAVSFDTVNLDKDGDSYILQLDGAEVAVDDSVDGTTGAITSEDVVAAINATDGFSARINEDDEVVVTKADGSNFTINEVIDGPEETGFNNDMADGRDLRGTISLESGTSIEISGTDPSKAGFDSGRTDPIVEGNYGLTLTTDDGDPLKVDMASAMRDGQITAEEVAAAINADEFATQEFSATVTDDGKLQISSNDGSDFKITEISDKDGGTTGDDGDINDGIVGVNADAKNFVGQVEIDSDVDVTLTGSGLEQAGLSSVGNETTTIDNVDVLTRESAVIAITSVDEALMDIDNIRGGLGAVQNRFEYTISNLSNVSENLSAARSRILDTDIASETSEMTKQNVLQQAGVSILAQANQAPQTALSLIG